MYDLKVRGHFDAAHFLRGYQGQCAFTHGHSFQYELTIEKKELDGLGMLIDFKDVKKIMKDVVDAHLDHRFLNETPLFEKVNPTAENLAHLIYDLINYGGYSAADYYIPFKVSKVTVWESPDCAASYWEE